MRLPKTFFWNGRRTAGQKALKFCIAHGESFAQLLRKFLTGSCQVAELWRHKRYSLLPIFQRNHVFSHVTCCHWQEWRYYAWLRPRKDHIWPLVHLDLSKVIRGQWLWLTPCILIVASLAVLGVYWGPEIEYVANFSHIHAYSASFHYPMSARAIDPVCPQAVLPMRVTLFPFGMLWVTNIPSINCNDTSFSSE